ncbi:ubiquitin [Scenedesmus sp. PABB004]|nr:ubiquitin [Scenedesmus sp. PABB004]
MAAMAARITDGPATWSDAELAAGRAAYPADRGYELAFSPHNPTPGTGRVGFLPVAPNNYPFYCEGAEVYTPLVQADGGQLSEWQPMYQPSRDQAQADRAAAYAAGVPHGFVAPGDRLAGLPTIELTVVSELVCARRTPASWAPTADRPRGAALAPAHELCAAPRRAAPQHDASEYGARVASDGSHSGGPFTVRVSPGIRVEELRAVIRDAGGILPALQRLAYAGKHLDDAQRTLQQYGVAYWHAKFPHWPLTVRRF